MLKCTDKMSKLVQECDFFFYSNHFKVVKNFTTVFFDGSLFQYYFLFIPRFLHLSFITWFRNMCLIPVLALVKDIQATIITRSVPLAWLPFLSSKTKLSSVSNSYLWRCLWDCSSYLWRCSVWDCSILPRSLLRENITTLTWRFYIPKWLLSLEVFN